MKKLFSFSIKPALILFFLVTISAFTAKPSWAQDCYDFQTLPNAPNLTEGEFESISFSFKVNDPSSEYLIHSSDNWPYQYDSGWITPDEGRLDPKAITNSNLVKEGNHTLEVEREDSSGVYCYLSYTVLQQQEEPGSECENQGGDCKLIQHGVCPNGYETSPIGGFGELGCGNTLKCCVPLGPSCHNWRLVDGCQKGFERCIDNIYLCCREPNDCPTLRPTDEPPDLGTYDICQGNNECEGCFNKDGGGKWAWTAVGCIPTDPTELIKWAFPYLLGFGGLATFLLIVFAGIQIMTSSGNPEKLKAGKELITSAVTGLIFIILSLFLLRVIGVDILQIPGLK